jgi:hypothetical protein
LEREQFAQGETMSLEGGEPLSARVHISEVPSLLEAAVNYARDGKPVFPCNPFDKAPLVGCDRDADGNKIEKTGGYYKATTDENQIRIWWTKWPNAMIGIRMGFTSGIWAIDPDVPDTLDDPDGIQNWDELQEVHGLAPPTRAHRTPSGGLHLLFKWRADKPVTTAEGRLSGLGINVRGEGGYIIAPPSINTNTVPYEVFDASEISEAPDWLYDLILGEEKVEETPEFKAASLSSGALRRYGDAALRNEVDKLSQTTTCRNIALNKAAFSLGQLVAIDALTRDRVAGELYHACERNGLTTDRKNSSPRRVRRTIQSGLDAGEKKPRIIPERPERHEAHQQQQGPAGGWPFQSAKDFRTDFNRNWIIKGVLAPGEVSTWCAPPKKGKSAVLGDLSLHVVAEALQEWRSYRCKKKGAVVYFALERADLVKRRFNAQAAQYGIDPKPLPFHVVGITIEMMSPGCVKAFLDTIKATEEACGIPVIVIVIDTSAKAIAAGGGEENSAKDKNILRANARRVIDALPDLHVAFVSHTGKDEERASGDQMPALATTTCVSCWTASLPRLTPETTAPRDH